MSPDGRILASGSDDNAIKLWDVATGRELRTFKQTTSVKSVAFSLDGRILASGGFTRIKLWDVASGKELKTLKGYKPISSIVFSPDGKLLALGGGGETKLWDMVMGRELKTLKGQKYFPIGEVAFSPSGKILASAEDYLHNTIKLWDVASGREPYSQRTDLFYNSVAFSPDSKTLATGSGNSLFSDSDNLIKLWDVASGQELKIFKGHTASVTSVSISPDGKLLASGSEVEPVKLWTWLPVRNFILFAGMAPIMLIRFSFAGREDGRLRR